MFSITASMVNTLPLVLGLLLAGSLAQAALREGVWGPSRPFTAIAQEGTRILNCLNCSVNINIPFTFMLGTYSTTSITVFSNGAIQLHSNAKDSCCPAPAILSGSWPTLTQPRIAVVHASLSNKTVRFSSDKQLFNLFFSLGWHILQMLKGLLCGELRRRAFRKRHHRRIYRLHHGSN